MDALNAISEKIWIGIDVSKSKFDVAFITKDFALSDDVFRKLPSETFSMNSTGVKKFFRWLEKRTEIRNYFIAMEATGSYSKKLFKLLLQVKQDLPIAIENAFKTSTFIKSLNLKIKTDRSDAKALAFFARERNPRVVRPIDEAREQIRAMSRQRESLVVKVSGLRTTLKESIGAIESKVVEKVLKGIVKEIEAGIKKLERETLALIKASTELGKEFNLLNSVIGVGPIVAVTVMGELGNLNDYRRARELSAFAGLSPRVHVSGSSVYKKTRMSKMGNTRIRKVLYMAAVSAFKNEFFEDFKSRLLEKGKHKMTIIGAIMRKLLVIMRAVIISGKPFDRNFKKLSV